MEFESEIPPSGNPDSGKKQHALGIFRRWLDRQPDRDPSQISSLEKFGRLALGVTLTLSVLIPLGWLIFR